MYPSYLERPLSLAKVQKTAVQIPLLYWFNEFSSENVCHISREFYIYLNLKFGSEEYQQAATQECNSGRPTRTTSN